MTKKHALAGLLLYFLFLGPSVGAAEAEFPAAHVPQKKLFVGERLVYAIRYLGVPVGKAEAEVKEITKIGRRRAYHVEVHVRSFRLIDWIYKVRDEHHSYIDVEKLHSLKYHKKLREGRVRKEEIVTFDHEAQTARYFYPEDNKEKMMSIPPDVQDQLSCGYYFRTLHIEPGTSMTLPVNADEKNWAMEVRLFNVKPQEIKDVGRFHALETEPDMRFKGIFVKKGKIRGWISMDERRIPIRMTVKIPVLGHVVSELTTYHPGVENSE